MPVSSAQTTQKTLSLSNYAETLAPDFDFQIQGGIIMYKSHQEEQVFGLWLYEKKEVKKICRQLSLCSIRSVAVTNQKSGLDGHTNDTSYKNNCPESNKSSEKRVESNSLANDQQEQLKQKIEAMFGKDFITSKQDKLDNVAHNKTANSTNNSNNDKIKGGIKFTPEGFFKALVKKDLVESDNRNVGNLHYRDIKQDIQSNDVNVQSDVQENGVQSLITKLSTMGVKVNDNSHKQHLPNTKETDNDKQETSFKAKPLDNKNNGKIVGKEEDYYDVQQQRQDHYESKPQIQSDIAKESAMDLITYLNNSLARDQSNVSVPNGHIGVGWTQTHGGMINNNGIMAPRLNIPMYHNQTHFTNTRPKINYLGYPSVESAKDDSSSGGLVVGNSANNMMLDPIVMRTMSVNPLNNNYALFNPEFSGKYYLPRSFYPQFNESPNFRPH
ncbi:hypothetical protein BB561_001277 [Smittium simulii]|uniref:Uncharacterized protein n=1 Tax=Smittium simulii TaxID=133385 RepID=A0A2T9YVD9_9FUNG|nr:hypothetical protein BB561_001277 [Smittium simulii]